MHAWEQIQRTLDEIENHIGEELNIQQLAETAALSPFYYQRLFSRLVKKPVGEYIRLRRLALAADALTAADKRILDVALEYGFSSHEHFTRAFRDAFGLTPDEYRRRPVALNRMTKPELSLNYTLVDEDVPLVTEGIVLEMHRKTLADPIPFLGKDVTFPMKTLESLGVESGVDPLYGVWEELHREEPAMVGLAPDADEVGVLLPGDQPGFCRYFAGARAVSKEASQGYAQWSLPRGEYVVCSLEAESFDALVMDALYKATQYVYNVWLPRRRLKTEMFSAERYPTHGPGTTQMEIWLQVAQ